MGYLDYEDIRILKENEIKRLRMVTLGLLNSIPKGTSVFEKDGGKVDEEENASEWLMTPNDWGNPMTNPREDDFHYAFEDCRRVSTCF